MLPKFDYFAPETLQETLELLETHGENARVLAGGTDLIVTLRARESQPKSVIDIKGVRELHEISHDERNGLKVAAAATLNRIINHDAASKNFPVLIEAIGTIGDYEIRNRATLVGNICNASPAADSAPALLVLDATINITSRKGKRTVPIREFFAGVKKTILAENELVTSINVPNPPRDSVGGYLKARRTIGEDLCVVGVGGLVQHDGHGRRLRLAYSSVAPTPVRALEAEKIFEQPRPIDQLLDQAMPIVRRSISPISDIRGGEEYRMHLVEVLTMRLVHRLWKAS